MFDIYAMFNIRTVATTVATTVGTTVGTVFSLLLIAASPSAAATFRYVTLTNEATFTEGSTAIAGTLYDGTFTNTVLNPFSEMEQTFSGFYQIQEGSLGDFVSLQAIQEQPTDRTGLGAEGVATIEYLLAPQSVSTVPGAFTVPPALTEFDFKFVPAMVSGAPTVVSNGWVAELVPEPVPKPVPEPGTFFAYFSLLGLGLGRQQRSVMTKKARSDRQGRH